MYGVDGLFSTGVIGVTGLVLWVGVICTGFGYGKLGVVGVCGVLARLPEWPKTTGGKLSTTGRPNSRYNDWTGACLVGILWRRP